MVEDRPERRGDAVDLERMLDLATPWCLHVAATLRIPEHISAGRQPAYERVFGRPFWEDLAAHPPIAAEFDALMGPAGHGVPGFDIELSNGWAGVRTIGPGRRGRGHPVIRPLRHRVPPRELARATRGAWPSTPITAVSYAKAPEDSASGGTRTGKDPSPYVVTV